MNEYNRYSESAGRGVPSFDDLSQRDVVAFMQRYFHFEIEETRLVRAVLDDRQTMAIVKEAYIAAQREGHTRDVQADFIERLRVRVEQRAESLRDGGSNYSNR